MGTIGYEFPQDTSQQWDGFNEPGIEHFSGSPFRSLGREGTQNTLDAAKLSPAKISIRRIDVPTSSIPDVDGLKSAIELCKGAAPSEGAKAKQFFDSAARLVGKSTVSVLQFSDSNTKGVVGPCKNGSPLFCSDEGHWPVKKGVRYSHRFLRHRQVRSVHNFGATDNFPHNCVARRRWRVAPLRSGKIHLDVP